MINSDEVKTIKEATKDLLEKMTIIDFNIELTVSLISDNAEFNGKQDLDVFDLNIKLKEPEILIGSNGQTLFELQRILRVILQKKLKRFFYLKLDINDYKKKKIEYLKNLAKDLADEVILTQKKKILSPMPAYQRRIIHIELAGRPDIVTESQGSGIDRYIVIRHIAR